VRHYKQFHVQDKNYIHLFRQGEESAFRHFFELFYDRLCYFAEGLLPDVQKEHALDIVQDAFVKLWERRQGFDNVSAIKAFLYLTVRNASLNIYKHDKVVAKHRMFLTMLDIKEQDVTFRLLEAEIFDRLDKAFRQLPEGCREVLYLTYYKGMKNEEISQELEISVHTVKSQKVRGLKLLRKSLGQSSLGLVLWECLKMLQ
jgi:RNA polymerase sigma-70 factor (family 1)